METLNIKKLSRLYHLTPSQRELERRLDATLNCVIEEQLQLAIERLGVLPHEEVCVRLVHIPLSFKLGQSQYETSIHWSEVIASSIKETIVIGGDNIFRFPSRFNALMDFAVEVSHERIQRAWAWNQLGLCKLNEQDGIVAAREQLIVALEREPTAILPVLIRLAETQRLVPFINKLSGEDCTAIFAAVLSQNRVSEEMIETLSAEVSESTDNNSASLLLSLSTLKRSRLVQHLVSVSDQVQQQFLVYWTCLVALELEPSFFNRPTDAIIENLRQTRDFLLQSLSKFSDGGVDRGSEESDAVAKHTSSAPSYVDKKNKSNFKQADKTKDDISKDFITGIGNDLDHKKTEGRESEDINNDRSKFDPELGFGDRNKIEQLNNQISDNGSVRSPNYKDQQNKIQQQNDDLVQAGSGPDKLIGEQQTSKELINLYSDFAGIILLLGILSEPLPDRQQSIVDQIVSTPVFNARSLSWVLYQIIAHLICISDDDPALRIFCGIDVAEDVLWRNEKKPSELETQSITAIAKVIANGLVQKLSWLELSTQNGFSPTQQLINKICCRSARIIAESGWVEFIFPIDKTDTDIRRAGLDLDPGYIPWLGTVVKIRYE